MNFDYYQKPSLFAKNGHMPRLIEFKQVEQASKDTLREEIRKYLNIYEF